MNRHGLVLVGALDAGLTASPSAFAQAKPKVIGLIWSNLQEERWKIGEAIIKKAINPGVAVVGYGRLIEIPQTFYLTFDNSDIGRMMVREVLKAKPEGNYVFIKGAGSDPSANVLFHGSMAVLEPANDAGTIKSVGEAFTDGWLPANGQRNMEQVAQPDEAVSVQR